MKKNLFIVIPLIAALALVSCFKNDVDPVTNKNSVVKIEGITFQNLVGNTSTSIKGYAKFEFYIANGTTSDITDTVNFVDSFFVTDPLNHTQTYNFDTPNKTKKIKFDVTFKIQGGGSATSVAVSKFIYKMNEVTHLETPLNFTTADGKVFTTIPQMVTF